jgi:hypothetical protein
MSPADNLKSRFIEYLLANNQPYMAGFRKWVFLPGMLFNSSTQWWGGNKPRPTPHEGLDLCWFENARGEVKALNGHTKIPAAFAGRIRKIDQDFLGQSIFMGHELFDEEQRQLHTIYGHTSPDAALAIPGVVAEGVIIGVIADRPGRKTALPAHLHITVAWVPTHFPLEQLTWQNLGRDGRLTLLDPLLIL